MIATQWQAAWDAVIHHPLFGVAITLAAFQLAYAAYEKTRWVFLQPVLVSMIVVVGTLLLCGLSYNEYRDSAQLLTVMLGPATVALAVPLVRQLPRLRRAALPLGAALLAGSVTAIVSAVVVALLLGATPELAHTLGPKSATSPIAMAVSERLGGIPALTAALVIGTGIFGAVFGRYVFDALRIRSDAARGFALGLASHGIGTARAFQVSAEMGAFAGLAMGLNGALTALLAPWLVPLAMGWMR